MLGSIEDLEKDIEQFKQNVAASSELQILLKQILEEIKVQNSEFDSKSTSLIARVDNIPSTIENANISSNNRVKNDVASEIDRALQLFTNEQGRYVQHLEQTMQQIQSYLEQSKSQEKTFSDKTTTIITKVDGIPSTIEAENAKSNAQIKSDVIAELQNALQKFATEQDKYIQNIEGMKQQIQFFIEQGTARERSFSDGVTSALTKFDDVVKRIAEDNIRFNETLKDDIDKLLANRNASFAEEQNKYISKLQQVQSDISNCENQLSVKYNEFIDTLQKMNVNNLYEQNIQLKSELNKRTTILMVISIISIIVGIIGIFI